MLALSDSKRTHIPYRNSLMTTVLRDSLGGNCLTTMLATLSVDFSNIHETISTCKFSQRVALVKSDATIIEEYDAAQEIASLKLEIDSLRKQLVIQRQKIVNMHTYYLKKLFTFIILLIGFRLYKIL